MLARIRALSFFKRANTRAEENRTYFSASESVYQSFVQSLRDAEENVGPAYIQNRYETEMQARDTMSRSLTTNKHNGSGLFTHKRKHLVMADELNLLFFAGLEKLRQGKYESAFSDFRAVLRESNYAVLTEACACAKMAELLVYECEGNTSNLRNHVTTIFEIIKKLFRAAVKDNYEAALQQAFDFYEKNPNVARIAFLATTEIANMEYHVHCLADNQIGVDYVRLAFYHPANANHYLNDAKLRFQTALAYCDDDTPPKFKRAVMQNLEIVDSVLLFINDEGKSNLPFGQLEQYLHITAEQDATALLFPLVNFFNHLRNHEASQPARGVSQRLNLDKCDRALSILEGISNRYQEDSELRMGLGN